LFWQEKYLDEKFILSNFGKMRFSFFTPEPLQISDFLVHHYKERQNYNKKVKTFPKLFLTFYQIFANMTSFPLYMFT